MPPIPDDAVVIADYMLMADFVRQANPTSAADIDKISKGVRRVSPTRDVFYNDVSGFYGTTVNLDLTAGGFFIASNSTASANANLNKAQLPAFGTTFITQGHSGTTKNDVHIDGVDVAHSGTSNGDHSAIVYPDSAVVLGQHDFAVHGINSTAYSPYLSNTGFQIATPIHTSSHYQTFETPFLNELVGGDRNMEQTNLVVTPDGKTWDEVTRDVGYISPSMCLTSSVELGSNVTTNPHHPILDTWRGQTVGIQNKMNAFQKNFAIAYDRVICLVPGTYKTSCSWYHHSGAIRLYVVRNQTTAGGIYSRSATGDQTVIIEHVWDLQRGDYLHITIEDAGTKDQDGRNLFIIEKVS